MGKKSKSGLDLFSECLKFFDNNFLTVLAGVLTGLLINTYTAFGGNIYFDLSMVCFLIALGCDLVMLKVRSNVNLIEEELKKKPEEIKLRPDATKTKEQSVLSLDIEDRQKRTALNFNPLNKFSFLTSIFLLPFSLLLGFCLLQVGENINTAKVDFEKNKLYHKIQVLESENKYELSKITELQDSLKTDHYSLKQLLNPKNNKPKIILKTPLR